MIAEGRVEKLPLLEVLSSQTWPILQSALLRMIEQSSFYIYTAFIFAYGVQSLSVSRDFLLSAVLLASFITLFTMPIFGHLSDRIGRKTMYRIGAITCGVFGFGYFAALQSGSPLLIFIVHRASRSFPIPWSMARRRP